MKLSLVLDVVSRGTQNLRKLTGDVRTMGSTAQRSGTGIGSMNRQLMRADQSADRLGVSGARMGGAIASGARRGVAALSALERRMQLSNATMNKLAYSAGSFIGSTIRGGAIAGATAAAGLGIGAMVKVVSAGMQFENFRTQLAGIEGSAAKAKSSFDWITKFAASTPYEVDQVTQAFIDARNQGIDPMNGALRTLGDSSAAMNKTFGDAIAMLGDASRFQFDRALDFGVVGSVKGAMVSLSYITKANKQAVVTVKRDSLAVQGAMLRILQERFGGGMELLSRTTEGKWRNLMDRLTLTAVKVWDAGVGPAIGRSLDRFTGWLDEISKDGTLDDWAKSTGQSIGTFIDDLSDPNGNMHQFAQDVHGIASAIGQLAGVVGQLEKAGTTIRNWLVDAQNAGRALGGIGFSPRGGLEFMAPSDPRMNKPPDPRASAAPRRAPRSSNGVPFFDANRPQRPAPQGKVSVHVTTDPGVKAKVRQVSASGMSLDASAYRGRAMGAPA